MYQGIRTLVHLGDLYQLVTCHRYLDFLGHFQRPHRVCQLPDMVPGWSAVGLRVRWHQGHAVATLSQAPKVCHINQDWAQGKHLLCQGIPMVKKLNIKSKWLWFKNAKKHFQLSYVYEKSFVQSNLLTLPLYTCLKVSSGLDGFVPHPLQGQNTTTL